MQGTPKSHRALCLTSMYCTHPEIDCVDKLLLVCLAQYGDHGTGRNARPGNTNIAGALGLKDRATDDRLTKNLNRGLIERTARANGRGLASAYRLCLESPHYPDRTPGGEWLIEQTAQPMNCADTTLQTAQPMNCAVIEQTAQCEAINRAVEPPKPRSAEAETAQSMDRPLPSTYQTPTTIPPEPRTENNQQPGKVAEGWMDGWLSKNHATMKAVPSKAIRAALDTLAEKHGAPLVLGALNDFLGRGQGFVDLKNPWGMWQTEGPTLIDIRMQDKANHERALKTSRATGDNYRAQVLAQVDAMRPLSAEEEGIVQAMVNQLDASLTKSGPPEYGHSKEHDYAQNWFMCLQSPDWLVDNIAGKRRAAVRAAELKEQDTLWKSNEGNMEAYFGTQAAETTKN